MNAKSQQSPAVSWDVYEACYNDWSRLLQEAAALRAENARLREALQAALTQMAQDNISAGSRDYEQALPYTIAKARAALAKGAA